MGPVSSRDLGRAISDIKVWHRDYHRILNGLCDKYGHEKRGQIETQLRRAKILQMKPYAKH